MTGIEAAGALVKAALVSNAFLKETNGLFSSVGLSKEVKEIVSKLPNNMDSSKELKENLKVLSNVSVKEVNIGIYKKKSIKYKEK